MLRPASIISHTEQLNDIVNDALDLIARNEKDTLVKNIDDLLFNWALEGKRFIFAFNSFSFAPKEERDCCNDTHACEHAYKCAYVCVILQ